MCAHGGQPVLLLKEGTSRTIGKDALRANIMAARILAETVKSSLGPKGMDKMLVDSFGDIVVTNDGATILKEMDVQHPAAKMMVEISKAQDDEVGDGTTTAVVLAGELLRRAEELLLQDVHPTIIMEGYKKSMEKAIEILDKISESVNPMDKDILRKVGKTTLVGKALVVGALERLTDMAIEAVIQVADVKEDKIMVDVDDVKIEKKEGGTLNDTTLIYGVVLDKEVVHPGMPKRVEKAKITLLNCPLEVEKTEISAKINITSPQQMRAFLDQETEILKRMVDKIKSVGANVVFCQKGIDDVAQHFLAKYGILAARRIKESDVAKLARATGARIVTSIDDLTEKDLGYAELVEERRIGEDKMIFVEGCKNPKSVSILVRGGSKHIVDEAERSFRDILCVIRDVLREPKVLAGGGAPEMEIAQKLRNWARTLKGKEQLAALKFASAVESIPITLAENAGLDPVDILVEMRAKHDKDEKWAGVNVIEGKVSNMWELGVLEPLVVKKQVIKSATEAAIMILRIDDIIAAAPPSAEKEKGEFKKEEETE
ncbi:MAG: TCP-1/cpn60 chaperonin family protein [Candidatus Methanomethylicia archaeon]|nr:TCP-1/cpn60 chaperonin family protein [Candidatus Methanomethylicia archaeon]MCX8169103.1 TCP-1/cpn60 chaperonin family protein [Candidatus Methanomethylicia archaeon]MDW7988835.1 thermosome subunit beta [Nitrososphaerota archaeon]